VRIEPVKPFSFAVKVPMVAISKFLSLVSSRALRGLDGGRKDRKRSDRTPGASLRTCAMGWLVGTERTWRAGDKAYCCAGIDGIAVNQTVPKVEIPR